MEDFYDSIKNTRRILIEAKLTPLQGDRFQPTGFPYLGAAEYTSPDGKEMLLVESTQSMANRMEAVCWDEENKNLVDELKGLPYIKVSLQDGSFTTSLHESHRIGSGRITKKDATKEDMIYKELESSFGNGDRPIDYKRLAKILLKYDPNSLIHGVWITGGSDSEKGKIGGGKLRIQRSISGFIEATNFQRAVSGGTKKDYVNPSLEGGAGNVPFSRTEYVAERIIAYFNVDLTQIRSFSLPTNAQKLLITLSLYKMYKFLQEEIKLRTACDLKVNGNLKANDEQIGIISLPDIRSIKDEIGKLIQQCALEKLFADPYITELTYKESKKAKDSKKETTEEE
jgi:CRISPR-associated protein Csb1